MNDDQNVDLDRILSALRERVLTPGETLLRVPDHPEPELFIRTNQRSFEVYRRPWAIRRESWVDDAIMLIGSDDGPLHQGTPILGLVFGSDGKDFLLADGHDDLAALGPRLATGMDPVAFAELLPLFHTGRWQHGTLYRDRDELARRFPHAAELPELRPPYWHRTDDDALSLTLQSFARTGGEPQWTVTLREWNVLAPSDRPASWSHRDLLTLPIG